MSNVNSTNLTAGDGSINRYVGTAVVAVAGVTFLLSWTTLLQWVDEAGRYAGIGLFQLFGVLLLLQAIGLVGVGVASRLEYVATTPSRTAGVAVAGVFAALYAGVASAVGGAVGGSNVAMVAGLAGGGLAGAAGLAFREDVGSTLLPAGLLAALGVVTANGVMDAGWVYEPAWASAVFPGSELVPLLVALATLTGGWSGAKAAAGFGARGREAGAYALIGTVVFAMLAVLGLLIAFIVVNGLQALTTGMSLTGGTFAVGPVQLPWPKLPFLTNVTGGLFVTVPGVLPAVIGTLWLVFGAVVFAVPLGIGAAVFLTEYAEQGRFTQLVEVATNGLWSTPSIVFGLFGLAFLVPRISGGNSILVGQLVLGFMLLPLVLITSRESIKAVPDEYRDASAALGVSRWQTIRSVVLPAAMPGTITGVILGVGRIAGETAPLLLVFGGSPYPNSTPNVLTSFKLQATPPFVTNEALLSPASALPYQLYSTITAGVFPKEIFTNQEFGWGTAFVLLVVVIGLYAIGVTSRLYFRRKLHED